MAITNILVVEDELIVALNIQVKLRQLGYEAPHTVASGEQALQQVREQRPDLILMDIQLAGALDGIETARLIQEEVSVPVVYLTAHADQATLRRAKATAPFGYIVKPFDVRELNTAIEMALYRHDLEQRLTQSEGRYRVISELVSDFAYSARLDAAGNVACEWVTDALIEISGYSYAEIGERGGWLTLIYPPDVPVAQSQIMRLLDNQPGVIEFRLVTKRGDLRWLRNHAKPVWDRLRGCVTGVIGAASDITDRKQAEERVQQLADRAQTLATLSRVMAEAGLNPQALLSAASRHMAESLGDACVITMLSDDRSYLHPVALHHRSPQARVLMCETIRQRIDIGDDDSLASQVVRSGQPAMLPSTHEVAATADLRHCFGQYADTVGVSSLVVVPLRAEGQVSGMMGLMRDRSGRSYTAEDQGFVQEVADRVSLFIRSARLHETLQHELAERRRAEERLAFLSTHDMLTGLYNRAYFDDETERLQQSRRFPISVILMDVDGLKQMNDTCGHAAGDFLLREVAILLRDVFQSDGVVARIGGDEFAVWLPGTDAAGASQALQRLRQRLTAQAEHDGRKQISLSAGSATACSGESLLVLLALADAAMYQVKLEHRAVHTVAP